MPTEAERQSSGTPIHHLETERKGRPLEDKKLGRTVNVRASRAIVTHDYSRSVGRALGHAPFGRPAIAVQVVLVPVCVRRERIGYPFKYEEVVPYPVAEWH